MNWEQFVMLSEPYWVASEEEQRLGPFATASHKSTIEPTVKMADQIRLGTGLGFTCCVVWNRPHLSMSLEDMDVMRQARLDGGVRRGVRA